MKRSSAHAPPFGGAGVPLVAAAVGPRAQRLTRSPDEHGRVGLTANEALQMINDYRHDAAGQMNAPWIAVLGRTDLE